MATRNREVAGSLSAADLHVVVMGEAFVGIVHPCKIYNILAVGAPVLYLGPCPSHVTEILDEMPAMSRPALEGPLLVAGTFVLSATGYALARWIALRPWLGMPAAFHIARPRLRNMPLKAP